MAAAAAPHDPYGKTISYLTGQVRQPLPNTQPKAHAQAVADVNSQLAAIHAAQQQALAQAAQRAASIRAAGIAGSGYLNSLGDAARLRDAFAQAGRDLTSEASGYTGQLQSDAQQQAAQVNDVLAKLGAPGRAQTPAAAAANDVYAAGAGPAQVFTGSAPFAYSTQLSLPGLLAAQGQQQAIGALGAGQQAAAAYNPDIAKTVGSLPGLERGIQTDLQSAAYKARQDAIGNLFKTLSDARAAESAQSLTDYRNRAVVRAFGSGGLEAYDPTSGKVTIIREPTVTPHTRVVSDANGSYLVDAATGRRIATVGGPPASTSNPYRYQDAFGREVQINPDGTQQVLTTGTYENANGYFKVGIDGSLTKTSGPKTGSAATTVHTSVQQAPNGSKWLVQSKADGSVTVKRAPGPLGQSKASAKGGYKIASSISNRATTLANNLHGNPSSSQTTLLLPGATPQTPAATAAKPYDEALRRVTAYLLGAGVPRKVAQAAAPQYLASAGYPSPDTIQAGRTLRAGMGADTVANDPFSSAFVGG